MFHFSESDWLIWARTLCVKDCLFKDWPSCWGVGRGLCASSWYLICHPLPLPQAASCFHFPWMYMGTGEGSLLLKCLKPRARASRDTVLPVSAWPAFPWRSLVSLLQLLTMNKWTCCSNEVGSETQWSIYSKRQRITGKNTLYLNSPNLFSQTTHTAGDWEACYILFVKNQSVEHEKLRISPTATAGRPAEEMERVETGTDSIAHPIRTP